MATAPSKEKNKAIVVVKSKRSIALPAAVLGYNSLVEPEAYEDSDPQFKANLHYSPAGAKLLLAAVQKNCIDAHAEKIVEESGFDLKAPMPVEEWAENKLKQPKPEFSIQLPFITIGRKAYYKNKDGGRGTRTIAVWDRHNNLLDLSTLPLGRGSVVEPIVSCNLFASKVNGRVPTPSVQLVGLRVLKLVSMTAQSTAAETDDAAIREAMGDDFEYDDDLTAYGAGATKKPPTTTPPAEADVEELF